MDHLINKADLPVFLKKLMENHEIIAPVNVSGIIKFGEISDFSDIDFSRQSDYPAKKYFLPAKEELFCYDKNKYNVEFSKEKRIIIMRPCDANSVLNMDKIFLEDENPDLYYKARRENTLLFVFKCTESYENCFCTSLNTQDTTNYDLLFIDLGDKYVVRVGSKTAGDLLNPKLFSHVIREGRINLECKKKIGNIESLSYFFNNEKWKEESKKCLSCNACITTCPSCFCFTIEDEPNIDLKSGKRQRCWNYCYMKNHTKVAGDHIFREERYKMFRHRIYHQLKYFKEKYGKHLCVGCGRCINACPTKIDMVDIVNSLNSR